MGREPVVWWPVSRRLDDLSSRFRPLAVELLARLVEAQIPVLIVDTLRTPAEQEILLATNRSWTQNSKHLTGDAIDLVPFELYTAAPGGDKLTWNADAHVWQRIGEIGERLGLRWGGRWAQRDMGHFEFQERAEAKPPVAA